MAYKCAKALVAHFLQMLLYFFSYFPSASPMFCTRHNFLVLDSDIFESCVTVLSWQESVNLIYYYFSSSPILCI